MKLLTWALASALFAAPAAATEWYYVVSSPGSVEFVDSASVLQPEPDTRTTWQHSVLSRLEEDDVRSLKIRKLWNCAKQEMATTYSVALDDAGAVKWTREVDEKRFQWRPVVPGSVDSKLMQYACRPAEERADPEALNRVTNETATLRFYRLVERGIEIGIARRLAVYDPAKEAAELVSYIRTYVPVEQLATAVEIMGLEANGHRATDEAPPATATRT